MLTVLPWLTVVALFAHTVPSSAPPAPLALARPAADTGDTVAAVTAFVDVTVIPMDRERVLPRQTVLVQHGQITALGPVAHVRVPVGARRIDGRGKYLLPGLADMHVHMAMDSSRAESFLFLLVANGVTTIRNMSNSPSMNPRVLALREQAAAGTFLSPRIYSAGPMQHEDMNDPAQIGRSMAEVKAAGYDFIAEVGPPNVVVMDSLAAASRREGVRIVGHVRVDLPLALTTYSSIEHLTDYVPNVLRTSALVYLDSLNELIPGAAQPYLRPLPPGTSAASLVDPVKLRQVVEATKRAGVWNCPTEVIVEEVSDDTIRQWPEMRYVSKKRLAKLNSRNLGMGDFFPDIPKIVDAISRESPIHRMIIKALADAGANLLLGTDAPVAYRIPGFSLHRELQLLVASGLTPYQALETGTRNPARWLGTLDSTGTIAVGKRADLVLLAGNPLRDIRQTAHPAGVMLGGRWLDRDELDRRLAAIGPIFSSGGY